MTLALRDTLQAGVDRAATRNGLVLIGTFLVLTLLRTGLIWVVSTTYLPLGSGTPTLSTHSTGTTPGTSPSFLVSIVSVALVSFTGGILTIPVRIVAIRTMVSRHTDRIPDEFVFHNMGWASLHTFIGAWLVSILVYGLALGILLPSGFLLIAMTNHSTEMWLIGHWLGWTGIVLLALVLLLPSVFLHLSLLFVSHEISIRDKNVIEAITASWRSCRGNRLRLLVLVLITFLLSIVASVIFSVGVPFVTDFNTILVQSIYISILTVINIVILSIMARAYVSVNDGVTIIAGDSQLSG
jgi:MFS family permease